MDATNLTIQFPRPEGLVEYYSVEYTLLKPPSPVDQNQTTILSSWNTAAEHSSSGLSSSGWKNFTDSGYPTGVSGTVNLGLDDLISGAGYMLRVHTSSHSMFSDPVNLEAHTSELVMCNSYHTMILFLVVTIYYNNIIFYKLLNY